MYSTLCHIVFPTSHWFRLKSTENGDCVGMDVAGGKVGEEVVEGECAGAAENDGERDRDGEEMVFESLAPLSAEPVHEEAVPCVDYGDGDEHIDSDGERGESGGETEDQGDTTGKCSHDGDECEGRGNVHGGGEKVNRCGEAVSTEETEGLLDAVSEENNAKGEPENGEERVVGGFDQLFEGGQGNTFYFEVR